MLKKKLGRIMMRILTGDAIYYVFLMNEFYSSVYS